MQDWKEETSSVGLLYAFPCAKDKENLVPYHPKSPLREKAAPLVVVLTFFRAPPIPAANQRISIVASSALALVLLGLVLAAVAFDTPPRLVRRVASMSDIQHYLLDYDRNKTEATATAQRSANRAYSGLEGQGGMDADRAQNCKAAN